uniref:Uncharacterized protein n=1 Tax=Amphimedon queenslandica TaxID=400682 RepID=A0A1X7SS86_AMPQE
LYTRLQRAGLCVFHRSTIRIAEKLGEDFDSQVKEWCHFLLNARLPKITVAAEILDEMEYQPIKDQPDAVINF